MEYRLTTPCTAQDLAPLRAGDTVLLSGVVYTARDQAHKRMIEALDRGEPLPFDLEGSAIYYVGPTPERPGRCPQRRGLSCRSGRCRCPDGQKRPDAGGHRLARPRL